MSENYPSDVKLNENPDGTVSFATEVVATIAGLAATEVDGVASMSAPSSGFADMFSRKNTRNFTKGVRIDLEGNKVTVDISIVVDYGFPVRQVAKNLQENVKKAVETMTGLEVRSVDIHVVGISFEREQKANAELDAQHRKLIERKAEESVSSAPAVSGISEEEEEDEIPDEDPEVEDEDELDEEEEEVEEEDDDLIELEDEDEDDDDYPEVVEPEPESKPESSPAPQPEPEAEPEPEPVPIPAVPVEDDIEDYVSDYEDYGDDDVSEEDDEDKRDAKKALE